ncbi:hypothetical protein TNCV_1665871 [Trichonephila clavipes]|nr:hypothetical protein TNCV_1665871 [Trichonephila clavipes]
MSREDFEPRQNSCDSVALQSGSSVAPGLVPPKMPLHNHVYIATAISLKICRCKGVHLENVITEFRNEADTIAKTDKKNSSEEGRTRNETVLKKRASFPFSKKFFLLETAPWFPAMATKIFNSQLTFHAKETVSKPFGWRQNDFSLQNPPYI